MKKILVALASATLMAAPLAALPTTAAAQHHGGGGGGGGWHGGGGGGGGWHGGGGWGGGYHGGGWGGYRGGWGRGYGYWGGGYPYFWGGLGLGYWAADPWYYDYPAYYGYAPYYGYSYETSGPADADGDYEEGPPPAGSYNGAPPVNAPRGPAAAAPSQSYQAPPSQACGQWVWDAGANKYNWVGC